MAGDAHDRAVRRDVAYDHGAAAHLDVVAERDVAQHGGAHAHDHAVAQRWVALAALLARAAERDALVELAVVANDGGLSHDDAHAVVDDEAPADRGAGMNLDTEAVAAPRGERAGNERVAVRPPPVLAAVRPDGAHAGRVEKDGDRRGGCRVVCPERLDVLTDSVEHVGPNECAARARRPARV